MYILCRPDSDGMDAVLLTHVRVELWKRMSFQGYIEFVLGSRYCDKSTPQKTKMA